VNVSDEADLSRRLSEEIDLPDFGPAPVDAVFRGSRVIARRRLAGIACAAAALAVVAGVLAARTGAGHGGGPGSGTTISPAGGMFASGSIGGHRWRLAVANLADPGRACLPGVVLNSGNGDLLQPGFVRNFALGNVGFLEPNPGRPGPGWAFVWLRPGVHDVAAVFSGGRRQPLRVVTVAACGQRFRLAGLGFPHSVLRITALSAQGRRTSYAPPPDLFNPASGLQDGQWFNIEGATSPAVSGIVAAGRTHGIAWQVRVTLGPNGECFGVEIPPSSRSASICSTIGEPPRVSSLMPVPYAVGSRRLLIWYPGVVNARTAYAVARLSDGTTRRLVPAIVGGRTYLALGTDGRATLVRLTLYDSHGHMLGSATAVTPR
jgi:hypothetical protein